MGMHMRVRTSARLRMRIPAQIHTYEGARPRALPEGLGFPVEKIEDMSAGEAEEHIAALYGDMAETYLVVDRIGIRVLRVPYTNKPYVGFYTTKRVGGGVQNPEAMKALKIAA